MKRITPLLALALATASLIAAEPSAALGQRMMKAADKNKDGKLSLDEYKPLDVQALHHGEEHFKTGDANHDGFLDPAEFTAHAEHKLKALEEGPVKKQPSKNNR